MVKFCPIWSPWQAQPHSIFVIDDLQKFPILNLSLSYLKCFENTLGNDKKGFSKTVYLTIGLK
jgi:hypothetical protein